MTKPKTKEDKLNEMNQEDYNTCLDLCIGAKAEGYAQALADVERIAIKNVGVIPSDWDDFIIKIQALKEQK